MLGGEEKRGGKKMGRGREGRGRTHRLAFLRRPTGIQRFASSVAHSRSSCCRVVGVVGGGGGGGGRVLKGEGGGGRGRMGTGGACLLRGWNGLCVFLLAVLCCTWLGLESRPNTFFSSACSPALLRRPLWKAAPYRCCIHGMACCVEEGGTMVGGAEGGR